MWDFNTSLGDEDDPEFETILLAGEEHPASVTRTETDEGLRVYDSFYIPQATMLVNGEITEMKKAGKMSRMRYNGMHIMDNIRRCK